MDTEIMVDEMYDEALNAAELGSIGKSRGFTKSELSSKTLFETVFLTERGLESAFMALDQKEIALLHLLSHIKRQPQANSDIPGKLITSHRQDSGMPDAAILEDSDISSPTTDISQYNTYLLFVLGQDGFTTG